MNPRQIGTGGDFGEAPQQEKGRGDFVDGGSVGRTIGGRMIAADEGVLGLRVFYLEFVSSIGCCGWADWGW